MVQPQLDQAPDRLKPYRGRKEMDDLATPLRAKGTSAASAQPAASWLLRPSRTRSAPVGSREVCIPRNGTVALADAGAMNSKIEQILAAIGRHTILMSWSEDEIHY